MADDVLKHALKEWAAICGALANGRQAILLRKGGIAEESETFLPAEQRFWLLPTFTHQNAAGLKPEGRALLAEGESYRRPPGKIRLCHFAEIAGAYQVHQMPIALLLDHMHVWTADFIRMRFAYRRPGIFVLLLRVFQMLEAHEIDDLAEYGGCKSWVTLREPLSTKGSLPVLSDADFRHVQQTIERILKPIATV